MARLGAEGRGDVAQPATLPGDGHVAPAPHAAPLRDAALSRSAARAYFVDSNPERARALAGRALRRDRRDGEALFVRMEVAGMEADETALLDAAMRLCELGAGAPDDPRVWLAATRMRESAANTPAFREMIPRIQSLLGSSPASWPELRAALLKSAMDGAPGLDAYSVSRAAGILTDWRIVGPFGHQLLSVSEQQPISPDDDLGRSSYQSRAVENFQFPDGWIVLPDYLSHPGVFYAAAGFASLTEGSWTVEAEARGMAEIYVDGQHVLSTSAARSRESANIEVPPGPHRLLLKLDGSATPLRVSIVRAPDEKRSPIPARLSVQELTYLLAAGDYAAGEFASAARQIKAISGSDSAALQFLLAQARTEQFPNSVEAAAAWSRLSSIAPEALVVDEMLGRRALSEGKAAEAISRAEHVLGERPGDIGALETLSDARGTRAPANQLSLWAERIALHPSCQALRRAIDFYRAQGLSAEASAVQQKLDGCAPESLDYARLLSEEGNHAEAARSLERLLAAAPLNRAARLMLVRELQVAGEDEAAQRAAASWMRVAPNAENYHRLAAAAGEAAGAKEASLAADFYARYRRDAGLLAHEASTDPGEDGVVLLDDHVAISRPDGSVSLYVHTTKRFSAAQAIPMPPQQAQVVGLRVLHPDGTQSPIERYGRPVFMLAPGDSLDEEYVLNYAGDGGIPEHPEAFQFVFGSFNEAVLHARFVVLSPAEQADRGVVIATGEPPQMQAKVRDGMLERIWDQETPCLDPTEGLAIIRVVEQENGWSEPSSAEHQRRLETIHPGPQPEDS
ncbi:MAG TPA: hypothetical protein VL240_04560 [Candidatus Binatia bacterium]|nr:hypothetical protein [Candidatus Binatia bacterium]